MDKNEMWQACLAEIRSRVRDDSYRAWFASLELTHVSASEAHFTTKGGGIQAGFIEDKYASLIRDALRARTGKEYAVRITGDNRDVPVQDYHREVFETPVNRDFTFENFVVGKSNEFAYSAALAISETPGQTRFNPLFIYGGTGLGKTHLLHAIANFINKKFPGKLICLKSSVQFTDHFIKSLEIKKQDDFNKFYKDRDLLLIDDIQFLEGKQETQNLFFHVFNDLYHNNKQIVITSDKSPKDLGDLEDRLVSRFQSGLTVDIQPPNIETKTAILHMKADKNRLNLQDDVIDYIAKYSSPNIREMEGYIVKLLAYSSMYDVDIDYAKAVEVLNFKNKDDNKKIYVEEVIEKVAKYYKTSPEKIINGSREKENIIPRQMAMYVSRKLTSASLKSIGKIFLKDHSTVVHGCKNMERILRENISIKNDMNFISKELLNK
jgi:chromosomal replication initiator protein